MGEFTKMFEKACGSESFGRVINAQCVTHVGIEVRNRCIRILLVCFPGRVGCL